MSVLNSVILAIRKVAVLTKVVCWPGDCIQKKPGERVPGPETRAVGCTAPDAPAVSGCGYPVYGVVVAGAAPWWYPVVWVRACLFPCFTVFLPVLTNFACFDEFCRF